MKKTIAILTALCGFGAQGFAAAQVEKSALLLLPEVISSRVSLKVSVEFRWDEDTPMTLDAFSNGGRLCTNGSIEIFDENGKEVPIFYPVSMPPLPTMKKEVRKGEVLKIGLYLMGSPQFPRPGRYYAIATFSEAFSGESNLRFTTKKRWFEVTGAVGGKA